MQNKIKKVLVIFPMIFLLCMSFIGINTKAEVKVDNQYDIATTSNNLASTEVDTSNTAKNKDTVSTSSVSSTTISGTNVAGYSPSDTNVKKNGEIKAPFVIICQFN